MKLPRRSRSRAAPFASSLAIATLTTGALAGAFPAAADDPAVMHHVKYTVFTEQPFRNAEIYYRDVDPPDFAEYSHNPYAFSPNVEADLGPNKRWTLDVQLANPDQWAMVTATSLDAPQRPNFHCVLAVDGKVVATHEGPNGALCSMRNW